MKTSVLLALGLLGLALPVQAAETEATAVVVVVPPNPAPAVPGSFDRLSPGQQKIARSLFDAQVVRPDGPAPMNLDQIATLRRGPDGTTGWGNVFKRMKADGLVEAKNLGQVVSASHHAGRGTRVATTAASSGRSGITVTNGRGRTVATGAGARQGRADLVASNASTAGGSSASASSNGVGHGIGGGVGGGRGHVGANKP